MTKHYAVKTADCTPEQIEQIYNLFRASMDIESSDYYIYEPNPWEFIVFEESEEIYQCLKKHLNDISSVLITPEEAIQQLFVTYLES